MSRLPVALLLLAAPALPFGCEDAGEVRRVSLGKLLFLELYLGEVEEGEPTAVAFRGFRSVGGYTEELREPFLRDLDERRFVFQVKEDVEDGENLMEWGCGSCRIVCDALGGVRLDEE